MHCFIDRHQLPEKVYSFGFLPLKINAAMVCVRTVLLSPKPLWYRFQHMYRHIWETNQLKFFNVGNLSNNPPPPIDEYLRAIDPVARRQHIPNQ
jgi:hypothetical protein